MLLDRSLFKPLITPFKNKLVGVILPLGNIGDKLHQSGLIQLLDYYKVNYYIENFKDNSIKADELIFSGGGMLGKIWKTQDNYNTNEELPVLGFKQAYRLRQKAFNSGKPVTIFPQSFSGKEEIVCKTLYVREAASLEYHDEAILAPDTALAYTLPKNVFLEEPTIDKGIWLKYNTSDEGIIDHKDSLGDPIHYASSVIEYIQLAARYKNIYSDRCHFIIAALIANQNTKEKRNIHILANSYHKNRSLWETWLKDLGVKWITRKELMGM